uniref:Solute carrier family 39 member 8 n=1 Tax=Electrophorus electricus TaxID=8005 RepID=A0A4W4GZ83_ELEEL
MSHFRWSFIGIFVGVLVCATPYVSANPQESAFLEDILAVYGENGLIDHSAIRVLLKRIVQENPTCLSAEELLALYGLGNVTHLDKAHLETVCPALLNQLLLPPCSRVGSNMDLVPSPVWGYGFLAVTIINLFSLLGLLLIPFTKKAYFPKVLTYFIGLAIGTLFSNAVLQLIPEALGFDPKLDNYIQKAVGIFGGFYLLFFMEKILQMVLKTDHEHGHSQFSPAAVPQQNGGTVIAVTSFSTAHSDKTSTTSDPAEERVSLCRCLAVHQLSGVKTVAWMITLSDAVHNFIDGLAIGASFTMSVLTGFSTSLAIVCEEFPHELGDFVILLNAGLSVPQAAFFNLLSAMSCYLGLVLGVLLGSAFAPNLIFAFAGGMFLYIALADMFPEMNGIAKEQPRSTKTDVMFFVIQNTGLLTGFLVIFLITMFAGDISLG